MHVDVQWKCSFNFALRFQAAKTFWSALTLFSFGVCVFFPSFLFHWIIAAFRHQLNYSFKCAALSPGVGISWYLWWENKYIESSKLLFWCNKSKETIKLHQKPYNEVETLTPKFWLCHILVGISINGNDYFFFIETHLYAPSASKQTTIECTRDQSHSLYVIKSKMKHPKRYPKRHFNSTQSNYNALLFFGVFNFNIWCFSSPLHRWLVFRDFDNNRKNSRIAH